MHEDQAQIDALAYATAIMDEGELYGLRVLYGRGDKKTSFEGVFTDPAQLVEAALRADRRARDVYVVGEDKGAKTPAGVYIIPNPVKASLAARSAVGELAQIGSDGIKDGEVLRRRALLLDFDSCKDGGVRGISATEGELRGAMGVALAAASLLRDRGWAEPIITSSGNGAHLVYRLDEPNDEATHGLVRGVILTLRAIFADRQGTADIDDAVHNASRLWRMPGTTARKGKDAPDRPHRTAKVLSIPEAYKSTSVTSEQLAALIEERGDEGAKKAWLGKAYKPVAAATPPRPAPTPRAAPPPRPAAPRATVARGAATPEQVRAAVADAMLADRAWVADAVRSIDPAKYNLDRDRWLCVANAIKALLGEGEGYTLWCEWSQRADPSYNGEQDWASRDLDTEGEACAVICAMARDFGSGWTYKAWREAHGVRLDLPGRTVRLRAPATSAERAALNHPLMPHWECQMPDEILAESLMAVASGMYEQMALGGARLVREGHVVMSCCPDTHRWQVVTQADVARVMVSWLGAVVTGHNAQTKTPIFYKGSAGSSSIYNEIQTMAYDISKQRQKDGVQLVLTDKVICVDVDQRRLVIEDLTPEHYATYGHDLDLATLKAATAPRWQEYLRGMFAGSEDPDRCVEYIKRWAALAVFGATVSFQVPALLLKGDPGTGKSTLGKVIAKLMPAGSVTSVDLQDFGHEYNRAELVGKLLNFVAELPLDEPIGDLDQVKKIIFGELTTAREIRQKPVSFHPRAAHLFCANGLPNLRKADPAVFARFAQLRVTGKAIRGTADDNERFAEELVAGELAGILSDLVSAMDRALHDLRARTPGTANGLPILAESMAARTEWLQRSGAVNTWLSETFEKDVAMKPAHSPTIAEMYREFRIWCEGGGYFAPNRTTFKTAVSHFYTIGKHNNQDVAVGAAYIAPAPASSQAPAPGAPPPPASPFMPSWL